MLMRIVLFVNKHVAVNFVFKKEFKKIDFQK